MPAGQPFTALCQRLAKKTSGVRADLHVHTTHSDGAYTPAQVIDLARRSGLSAIAITDHDTLTGVGPARRAAEGTDVEVVAGVEVSSEYGGREIHLLGYFVSLEDTGLTAALDRLRAGREERFRVMAERLRQQGVVLEEGMAADAGAALGRRHLAELLVRQGKVATVREAFRRYLGDASRVNVPKVLL